MDGLRRIALLEQLRKAKELKFMSAEMCDLIEVGHTGEKLFNEMIMGEAFRINRWEYTHSS